MYEVYRGSRSEARWHVTQNTNYQRHRSSATSSRRFYSITRLRRPSMDQQKRASWAGKRYVEIEDLHSNENLNCKPVETTPSLSNRHTSRCLLFAVCLYLSIRFVLCRINAVLKMEGGIPNIFSDFPLFFISAHPSSYFFETIISSPQSTALYVSIRTGHNKITSNDYVDTLANKLRNTKPFVIAYD